MKIHLINKINNNSAISLNRPKTDEKPNADVQEPSYNIKSSSNTILLSKLIKSTKYKNRTYSNCKKSKVFHKLICLDSIRLKLNLYRIF